MMRSWSAALVCTASLLLLSLHHIGSGRAPGARDRAALYETLRRASVKILVNGRLSGSGCFVEADGLVLTAAHVVRGAKDKAEVVSPVAGRMPAERVAIDFGNDIALLKVPEGVRPYPVLKVADRMPAPTVDVLLVSSPLWRHDLVLKGSVARLEPTYCWNGGSNCYVRCYYIAGASPIGSSGGCWVDGCGRIVGVQSGYLNNSDKSPVGIAFCSTPGAIRKLISKKTSTKTATLGGAMEEIWTQSAGFIKRLPEGTEGIVPPLIQKGGAMAKAGLTKETVIIEADGRKTDYLDTLLEVVRAKKPGDTVNLKVIEPIGKPAREVEVTLGEVGG